MKKPPASPRLFVARRSLRDLDLAIVIVPLPKRAQGSINDTLEIASIAISGEPCRHHPKITQPGIADRFDADSFRIKLSASRAEGLA